VLVEVFDVAIIGLGPIGAVLANLLGQKKLSVLVLERDNTIYPLPRAIHFDGEVMRVFETIGLRKEVEAVSRPGIKGMHFLNEKGETLLIRSGGTTLGPHGCATNYYFHQPDLEQVLRTGIARHENVVVELNTEVLSFKKNSDSVSIQTNSKRIPEIKAKYIVGCDGARSIVRKSMGSATVDLGLNQPWLVFDVLLNQGLPSLPEYTVQHCNPKRPMTFCNVTELRRRWEIMLMPGDDPKELVKPETIWSLLSPWLKPEQAQIERATIYTFHSIIAKGWRDQRSIIAGDAAHQMPPFLGQGMCAGIRDVANLAWKLVSVLRGIHDDSLLDTYEQERAPHVKDFVALAVKIGAIIQVTDPTLAAKRDADFLKGATEVFHFPTPRLSAGLISENSELYGQIFPQPTLDDGSLLDSKNGYSFTLIALPMLLQSATHECKKIWETLQVRTMPAIDISILQWLTEHGFSAVMLRPDRYIFGVAKNRAELIELSKKFSLLHVNS
jgi:3-(3-hydroxy-phenyl)propionate hydroxylase